MSSACWWLGASTGVPPWVFVGGTIEPGETPAEAAVREAREEEAGLVVPP